MKINYFRITVNNWKEKKLLAYTKCLLLREISILKTQNLGINLKLKYNFDRQPLWKNLALNPMYSTRHKSELKGLGDKKCPTLLEKFLYKNDRLDDFKAGVDCLKRALHDCPFF